MECRACGLHKDVFDENPLRHAQCPAKSLPETEHSWVPFPVQACGHRMSVRAANGGWCIECRYGDKPYH